MEAAVTAPHDTPVEPSDRGQREIRYVEAINEAMHQEMERDERVFVMGLDVAGIGGIFSATKGLKEAFGVERVRDTPLSEMGFSGAGVGAAAAGLRPIVEIQIFDFVTYMMDAIVNQAAKFRFMLGGKPTVPIVFRGPQGSGIRMAAQHSQSFEAWFNHVPGLVVMAPSSAYDAKGLLTSAIRDDNPVIFLEHKLLYLGEPSAVPEEPYAIPIGKAAVRRQGSDATVVATQVMVDRALAAAQLLEREGISIEIIDPRTIKPLDTDTILSSVAKTNRLVVVHEAPLTGGFGGEVAALVAERGFDDLDAPVLRLGGREVPIPYNEDLERAATPQVGDIVEAVKKVLG
ncbi:MAG: alpha-ketoacid dehydrogenase subunit beta [Alphaproteobacteria bacterium]|nr:alpha-ketoacid dehydrogenase subunit beta [Alphaproteobacteria bacterium]